MLRGHCKPLWVQRRGTISRRVVDKTSQEGQPAPEHWDHEQRTGTEIDLLHGTCRYSSTRDASTHFGSTSFDVFPVYMTATPYPATPISPTFVSFRGRDDD